MSTPLGHALVGGTVGFALAMHSGLDPRRGAIAGAIAGMAPDLDFVPGLLIMDPARFHHGPTHSLAAALAIGTLAASIAKRARLTWGLLIALAWTTHLVLDFLTLDDSPPYGFPLLWPLLDRPFTSPAPMFANVIHSSESAFNRHNFELAACEVMLFAPPLLALAWWRSRRRSVLT